MVFIKRRNNQTPLLKTIQYSFALLLTGCAASIDATKDVQSANMIALEHLPVVVDDLLVWNSTEPLTVDSAIAFALSHDVLLQRDFAVIVQRRAEIAQAELPANPTISGAFGIAVDGLAGAPIILQGVQSLGWLWTRPDRIASAEQSLQQAILTAANRTLEVVADVRIAHFQATTQAEFVNLTNEDVLLTTKTLELTQILATAGEASDQDVDKAKIGLLSAQHTHRKKEEDYHQAVLHLLRVMGCPETQTTFSIESPAYFPQVDMNEETLFSHAISTRLDLATQRAIIEQRSSELGLANPPLISASVMFNENFTDRQALMPGGSLTIALDGDAKEAVADSKLKQAELSYIESLRNVVQEVRSLYASYIASDEKLSLDFEVLTTIEDTLNRAIKIQNQGELHPLDVIPIKRDVIRAKQHAYEDALELATNAIQLEQAVGGTFKGIQP